MLLPTENHRRKEALPSFLGFQWVTYWSVLKTFFFLAFPTEIRTDPRGFSSSGSSTTDQDQNSDSSFSTWVKGLFPASCSHTSGSPLGPPHTPQFTPPICSNYPLELESESESNSIHQENTSGPNFQNKAFKFKICVENRWHFLIKCQQITARMFLQLHDST